jgi:hypothetical protein
MPRKPSQRRDNANHQQERRQVFVAYSYRLYPKADYRKVYKEIEKSQDVTFVFADEKITNVPILKKIETIRAADFAIFDVSGWAPSVALELGFAMALGDRWYVAIDPSKTDAKDVPQDLCGLGRIEYGSLSELSEKLETLLKQRYPRRTAGTIDANAGDRRVHAPANGRRARAPRMKVKQQSGEDSAPTAVVDESALNAKEKVVLDLLRRRRAGVHLEEIGTTCFGDQGAAKANSWARNSLRRLVASELVRQIGRGTYVAASGARGR